MSASDTGVYFTSRVIEARRSEIVIVDKLSSKTTIIDIAVPGDFPVKMKESVKIEKYQDLALELTRLRKTSTKVVPIHCDWSCQSQVWNLGLDGPFGSGCEELHTHTANSSVGISEHLKEGPFHPNQVDRGVFHWQSHPPVLLNFQSLRQKG